MADTDYDDLSDLAKKALDVIAATDDINEIEKFIATLTKGEMISLIIELRGVEGFVALMTALVEDMEWMKSEKKNPVPQSIWNGFSRS